MSKVVTCPVKRFAGTVTLRDPMTFMQTAKWAEALHVARSAPKDLTGYVEMGKLLIPLIVDEVEAWELKNITPPVTAENFPNASAHTSADSIHELFAWLIQECRAVYDGNEEDDPNE